MNRQTAAIGRGKTAYGFRWAILALLFFLQTSASLAILAFGPLAPFLQEDLHISRAQVGLFTSLGYAASLFVGVLCGWLIDRFGVRGFLLLGPALLGLFFSVVAKAPSYGLALMFVFLGGAGYSFVNPASAKALTHWFSPDARATAIGIMKSGVTLGGALGGAMLPALALMLGWRSALASVAIAVVALGLISIALYRDLPGQASAEALPLGLAEFRRVLTNVSILLVGGLGVAYSAIQLSLSAYLVLFLKEAVHLSVVMAGTYLTVAALSGAAGRVLWGMVSDRVFAGRRSIVLFICGLITATTAMFIAFLATAVPWWLLYILMAVFGFSAIGWNALFITFLAELGGRDQAATAVGFGISITNLGVLFGPPSFGLIVDITHSYTPAWVVFGICAAAGGALMLLVRDGKKAGAREL